MIERLNCDQLMECSNPPAGSILLLPPVGVERIDRGLTKGNWAAARRGMAVAAHRAGHVCREHAGGIHARPQRFLHG